MLSAVHVPGNIYTVYMVYHMRDIPDYGIYMYIHTTDSAVTATCERGKEGMAAVTCLVSAVL